MFSYIKGSVAEIRENCAVIECNGIGYLLQVSAATAAGLSGKKEAKVYTHMVVREDSLSLVGFLSKEDLEMFELLNTVTGVGAKAALSVQSALTSSQLVLAVLTDDVNAISRAQGIGKKLALRIALELKDKVKAVSGGAEALEAMGSQQVLSSGTGGAKHDAVEALVTLGYGRSDALRAVMEVALEGMDAEQIIKPALKKLMLF